MNERELVEAAMMTQLIEKKALNSRAPYAMTPKLREVLKIIGEGEMSHPLLVGIDPLLGEYSGYAWGVNQAKEHEPFKHAILIQFSGPRSVGGECYDLFVFGKPPFRFYGHYSTNSPQGIKMTGGITKVDEVHDIGQGKFKPSLCALTAALDQDVRVDPRRN